MSAVDVNTRQTRGREIYKDNHLHLVEYEPQCRITKFRLGGRYAKYYLAFPYVQLARYDYGAGSNSRVSLHASFSNEPIKDLDSPVFLPCLPNCWSPSLQVCIYPTMPTIEHFFELFWSAWFTPTEQYAGWSAIAQTPMACGNDKETNMPSFKKWAEMSKEDPSFITKVNWPIAGSWRSVNQNMEIRGFAVFPRQ